METLLQQKDTLASSEPSRQGSVPESQQSDGASLYRVVSRLPQQIRQDYPPLLHHFLQCCVICSVAGENADNHTTPECSRRRAVLNFNPSDNGEAMQLHRKLVFEEKSTHLKMLQPVVCLRRSPSLSVKNESMPRPHLRIPDDGMVDESYKQHMPRRPQRIACARRRYYQ
jgi:hypothetical protein